MRASWHTPFSSWAKGALLEGPLPLSASGAAPGRREWQVGVCLFPGCNTHLVPGGSSLEHSPPPEEGELSQASSPPNQPSGPLWGWLGPWKPVGSPERSTRHWVDSWGCQGLIQDGPGGHVQGPQATLWSFPVLWPVVHATLALAAPWISLSPVHLSESHLKN